MIWMFSKGEYQDTSLPADVTSYTSVKIVFVSDVRWWKVIDPKLIPVGRYLWLSQILPLLTEIFILTKPLSDPPQHFTLYLMSF